MSASGSVVLRAVFIFIFVLLWLPAVALERNAEAGTLSIQTRSTMEVTGKRLRAEIEYTNNGTSTALGVQAHLTVSGRRLSGPVTDRLGPGESDSSVFEMTLEGVPESSYPFIAYVDFNDENDYPFSALSCGTFPFLGQGPSDIDCTGSEITISDEGHVEFTVRNRGTRTVEVSLRLVLPREFTSPRDLEVMDLEPGETVPVDFRVRNSGALAGGSYPVFCIAQYEVDGRHGSAVGGGLIAVAGGENLFRRHRSIVEGVFILAGVLFAAVLVREMLMGRNAGKARKTGEYS